MSQTGVNVLPPSSHGFADLVDVRAFARMLENFHQATGIANGLVGVNGELLCQAGWTRACAFFHRGHPQSNAQCIQSNLSLMQDLRAGCIASDLCDNGLLDYATPVVVEGRQLATLFLGQVLHTPPDLERFRDQAQRFGYDTHAYLEAIQAIPVMPRQQLLAHMAVMVNMAEMLAASGLARLRQMSLERDLCHSDERRIELEDILASSPVAVGWSNTEGRIEYINFQFTQLFGYRLLDVPDLDTWYQKAYPDADYRREVIEPWQRAVEAARQTGQTPPTLESRVTCKDGSVRHVAIRLSWVGNRRLVNFSDETDKWESLQRMRAHDAMLEMVASGAGLQDILEAIVRQVEQEDPSALCSILLLDANGQHLKTTVAPRLPAFYSDAINGVQIGPGVGSCGTAAYTGERVVVSDIATHPYWTDFASLAQSASLRACWSEPILSSSRQVLGTFAIYHDRPSTPTDKDIERIGFAANLCAIAIEHRRNQSALEAQAYSDPLTGLANRRAFLERATSECARATRLDTDLAVLMMDIDHFKRVNDTHGHVAGDRVLKTLADVCRTTLRASDVIGRIGGEEFAILLPDTGTDQALETAERLREALAAAQTTLTDDTTISVTASIGLTSRNGQIADIDTLLAQADDALYRAKREGRNRVCRFELPPE
jgi:diguanylate cyclase (GGDEF)-like protein/PAS domain S-box-containing protein